MNQLEHDIIEMTMYKVACLTEDMEKTAGRTYKDPLNRLYNQIQHNSWALNGKGSNSEAVTNKIIQKLKADPLVAKQFMSRAIDSGWKPFQENEGSYSGLIKAVLFNKHKKDVMPQATKDLADLIHSAFNMNGAMAHLRGYLPDYPLKESGKTLYDEISNMMH